MKTPKTIRAVTALTQQGQGWDCCNTTDGQSDSEIQLLAKKKKLYGHFPFEEHGCIFILLDN